MEISWTRSAGSALGAVSAAVLLSTLGVAGTLIGAALGSLVITVGGALYSSSLQATKERVVKATARKGQTDPPARVGRDSDEVVDVPTQERRSAPLPEDAPPSTSWGQMFRDLPWKRVAGVAVAVFVVAMGLILAFELTTGRAVSSYTGGSTSTGTGTSIPGFDGRGGSGAGTEQDPQQQDEAPQDPQQPGEAPQQDEAPQPEEQAPQPEAPPADPGPQEAPAE